MSSSDDEVPYNEDGVYVDENRITSIESMCMNCHENGKSMFYLTAIPHFKEIIVSSFFCRHCGHKDTGVQFSGVIQPMGVRISCKVNSVEDLSRQVVKSDNATIIVPELELEMPPETQKGKLSTIEGFLRETYNALDKLQPVRRIEYPEAAEKIDTFLQKMEYCFTVDTPFTFIIDDPSGNSFIENPVAPLEDPKMKKSEYVRTPEQNLAIGLTTERDSTEPEPEYVKLPTDKKSEVHFHAEWFGGIDEAQRPIKVAQLDDVLRFPRPCHACQKPGEERMVHVEIPYFKEVILMSFACDYCGYRHNDIKTGGSISEKGKRIELSVQNRDDLSRDILKSDTASLKIPEIDLSIAEGTLGGRFTTVEGMLSLIKDQLTNNPFIVGDSTHPVNKKKWETFIDGLKKVLRAEIPFTFIIDDPLANSYIQSYTSPDPDPQIKEEFYERSQEQNDDLGLSDMNTKDFETIPEENKP